MTVALVIPALNEEGALPAVLAAVPHLGQGWALRETVVADNGSTDRTAEVARVAGATVVREPRRGYGAACLAALAHLRARPPDIVVFLDADGSDDPAELGTLLAPILEDRADLVVGSRELGEREPGALSAVQAFGNRLASVLLRLLFGMRATDLGPYRAIRWEALERLGMRDRDYGWTVEMQARAARARLRTVEVPVRCLRRRAGRSKVAGTVRGALGAGWKILFTIARVRLGG
ncbi:MAG: glycosyltransferase family 2 protein [Candidatus Eisenbacteria bacterium]|nr:glycosyltransferase family 2 protein [Candidatus Eisenbacteria bacterium]